MMAAKKEDELFEIMSSYGEPNDSETQGSNSESSEDDISETSEDRAFMVSDADQSPYSNRSSGSSDYSQHCPDVQDNDSSDLAPLPNALSTRVTALLYSIWSYGGPGSRNSRMEMV
ncbi:unnamed protein product [Penicillium salamii]|nr:unnamed protein product [Penicillium salamii]CAG8099397.1 unnamed protein product [Penicillium salamii]CAG8367561.1 unnamed protein product [Penicillium salamii]CAG8890825.1 unnamed protein product [Penicillium salamii]